MEEREITLEQYFAILDTGGTYEGIVRFWGIAMRVSAESTFMKGADRFHQIERQQRFILGDQSGAIKQRLDEVKKIQELLLKNDEEAKLREQERKRRIDEEISQIKSEQQIFIQRLLSDRGSILGITSTDYEALEKVNKHVKAHIGLLEYLKLATAEQRKISAMGTTNIGTIKPIDLREEYIKDRMALDPTATQLALDPFVQAAAMSLLGGGIMGRAVMAKGLFSYQMWGWRVGISTGMQAAINGGFNEVDYFDVAVDGFMGRVGPAALLSGAVDWRPFSFDREKRFQTIFYNKSFLNFAIDSGSSYLYGKAFNKWMRYTNPHLDRMGRNIVFPMMNSSSSILNYGTAKGATNYYERKNKK